jgi:membrane-bound lytic murein transglycosylase D
MLPPSVHPYPVKIPVGTYDTFVAAYQALPEELRRPAEEHTVHSGETLSGIASKYGTSTSSIMRLNGLKGTRIHPGQRLAVPMLDKSYTADRSDAMGPNPIQYPKGLNRPVAVTGSEMERPNEVFARVRQESTKPIKSTAKSSTKQVSTKSEPKANQIVYRVKSGDTLGEIAEQFRVRASSIRSWNNLRGSRIIVGQKLTIYSNAAPSSKTYQVRRGDTLSKIASQHGVSVADLKKWNGLKNSRIKAGQQLVINA